jgi:hypothetical protein
MQVKLSVLFRYLHESSVGMYDNNLSHKIAVPFLYLAELEALRDRPNEAPLHEEGRPNEGPLREVGRPNEGPLREEGRPNEAPLHEKDRPNEGPLH